MLWVVVVVVVMYIGLQCSSSSSSNVVVVAVVMLWVVAGLFAVSWLPYHAVSLYLNFVSDNRAMTTVTTVSVCRFT